MRTMMLAISMVFVLSGSLWAADHKEFMPGPYPDGPSVTMDCLGCHYEQGRDFIETAHWLWEGPSPHVVGLKKGVRLGKRDLMNNF